MAGIGSAIDVLGAIRKGVVAAQSAAMTALCKGLSRDLGVPRRWAMPNPSVTGL
jgi:hypothetical protein